jgi:ATPase family AAA domain-containing protein 1
MLAKALARESNLPFISVGPSIVENKFYGESPKIVASLFSLARSLQPCILFFDEIDGMMRSRVDDEQACAYAVKTEFLTQMDGTHTKESDRFLDIIESLDPALRRRMRRTYRFPMPDESSRAHILSSFEETEALSSKKLLDLASVSEGFSGSDLRALVDRANSLRLVRVFKELKGTVPSSGSIIEELEQTSVSDDEWDAALKDVRDSILAKSDIARPLSLKDVLKGIVSKVEPKDT